MSALTVYVDGIGFWAPGLADWSAFSRAVEQDDFALPETPSRPAPGTLPPTERRARRNPC